jgi:hypothetical protein
MMRNCFIPEEVVRSGSDAAQRGHRLVSASAVGALGLVYFAIAVRDGRKAHVAILFAAAAVGVLLAPVTLRATKSLRVAGSQLVASLLGPVLLIAATTSGLKLPELVWLTSIPLIGISFVGRKFAMGWTAIALVGIGALSLLDRVPVTSAVEAQLVPLASQMAPWTRFEAWLSLTSVLCVLLCLALALDQTRSDRAGARVEGLTHRINNPLQNIASNTDYLSLVLARPRASSALTDEEKEELRTALQELRRGVEQVRDVVGELGQG